MPSPVDARDHSAWAGRLPLTAIWLRITAGMAGRVMTLSPSCPCPALFLPQKSPNFAVRPPIGNPVAQEMRIISACSQLMKSRWKTTPRWRARRPGSAANSGRNYFCAFDRNTPRRVQVVLIGALAYFVLPFDFIPDMLPLIGFTDDAAVLATAIRLVAVHITPQHREAARRVLARAAAPPPHSPAQAEEGRGEAGFGEGGPGVRDAGTLRV